MEWTLEDIGPVIDPDEAITTMLYPRFEIEKWISAQLRRGQSAAEVAADLRARAEKYDETARAESPRFKLAHHALLWCADKVEVGWDPWVDA